MLMPSIFGENLFDDFFGFPFYDDKADKKVEKKLYGRHAQNLMKTDIKETDAGYELEIDLPGFTKDEVSAELNNGYLTVSAARGWIRMNRRKIPDVTSDVSVTQVPAREASMLAMMSQKKISKASSNVVS